MIFLRHSSILIMLIIFCSLRSIAQSEFYQVGFELYKGTATEFSDIVYCNMETGGNPGIDNSDLPKLDQFAENISVYRDTGVNAVKRDFGIETRPLINCRDTIQLRLYKTPTTTTNFRLVVDMNAYPVTPGLTAVMQDRFLNTERPLKFGDTTNIFFTITSNANTTGFRFRVVFRRTQVTTDPFTQLPAICRGEAINLPATSSNGVKGTWTPAVNNTATTNYTFIPSEGQCATSPTMTVIVNQPVSPTFTQVQPICTGGAFTLPTTSNNDITGAWSPTINNTQTTDYTFTPSQGSCATTAAMTVTINQRTTPTFTYGTSLTICKGDVTPTLQAISQNNIVGLWDPVNVSNTESQVYTFTPAPSACATTATFTVTVNQPATPTFNQVSAICNGGTITLPTTSTNSISGSWLPSIDNTQTTTYTFTPAQGLCATTASMTVTVNQRTTPTFTYGTSLTICKGDATPTLQVISQNNIVGLWDPINVSNTESNVYTFTPAPSACATTATFTVTVNQPVTPAFDPLGPFTSGTNFTLPTTSNNGINGNWLPAINNTQTTTYTFTPDAGQCAGTAQLTVTINEIPTSVVYLDVNKHFKLFPNPVDKGRGSIQLELSNYEPGKYMVSVFSFNGVRLRDLYLQHGGGTATYSLPADQIWQTGMYLIRVSGHKNIKTQNILFVK